MLITLITLITLKNFKNIKNIKNSMIYFFHSKNKKYAFKNHCDVSDL
jgi:hypothetical protein